jgi:hypothetical protein
MNLEAILADVGLIERIDWDKNGRSAFVHFSEWYDTPLSERILMDLDEGLSYRVPYVPEKYLIVRKNQSPLAKYTGPFTIDYMAEAIETLRTAYIYGRENVLKPRHIRFDEHGGESTTVVDWYVPNVPHVAYSGTQNIHQVAAEYAWWIHETMTKT